VGTTRCDSGRGEAARGGRCLDQEPRDGAGEALVAGEPVRRLFPRRLEQPRALDMEGRRHERREHRRKETDVEESVAAAVAAGVGVVGRAHMHVAAAAGAGIEFGPEGAGVVMVMAVSIAMLRMCGPRMPVIADLAMSVAMSVAMTVAMSMFTAAGITMRMIVLMMAMLPTPLEGDAEHPARGHADSHLREQDERKHEPEQAHSHLGDHSRHGCSPAADWQTALPDLRGSGDAIASKRR